MFGHVGICTPIVSLAGEPDDAKVVNHRDELIGAGEGEGGTNSPALPDE